MPISVTSTMLKAKSNSPLRHQAGFTLIEIMVVVGIVVGMLSIALPRMIGSDRQVKADLRRFAIMTRKLFQEAQIRRATFRIAIDMTGVDEKGDKAPHSYWVEFAPGKQLPEGEEEESRDDEEISSSKFQMDSKILKGKKKLPEGFIFSKVSFGSREEVREGVAYIYFFPQGFTKESLIQISYPEKEMFWSFFIDPLTGHTEVFNKDIGLDDLKQGR